MACARKPIEHPGDLTADRESQLRADLQSLRIERAPTPRRGGRRRWLVPVVLLLLAALGAAAWWHTSGRCR
ncbi:MAG: hypothetical protein U0802_15650 [Candidatus Binatia bacterium]